MKIYTYLSLPALFVHELMHIIFGLLSGYVFSIKESWTMWHKDGSVCVGLEPKNEKMNLAQLIMVPMAPLYFVIALAILCFVSPVFIGILIYFIVTYFYSFPSAGDFLQMRYAKVYLKYKFEDEVFVRFMAAKANGTEFMSNITIEGPED